MKKISKILFFILLGTLNCGAISKKPKKLTVSRSRNPFYLEEKKEHKSLNKKNEREHERSRKFLLEGIMQSGKNLAAVLSDGQDSEVVVVGDHIGDYKVKEIDDSFVVLIRGKKTKKLELD